MFPNRLKKLRTNRKLTQQDMADYLGISRQGYAKYENEQSEPDYKTIKKLASFFDVSTDYILGLTDLAKPVSKLSEHTDKEGKDIVKDLIKIVNSLRKDEYDRFDGKSIDRLDLEDKELLIISLENSIRLAKRLIKVK